MKIKVSEALRKLAGIFEKKAPLYIVGGYVRNALMGYYNTDVDLASPLSVEDIFQLLDNTPYLVRIKSAKMGTVEIFCGRESYEHTTFRSEAYGEGGRHTPLSVSFGASIVEDAARRDFTVNAIYYTIIGGEIIDFYGGVRDIKARKMKCVETPEKVFCSDGLRILRLVRQCSELNFEIEEQTYKGAIKYKKNLKGISGERRSKELDLILASDLKYAGVSAKNAPQKAFGLLADMQMWKCIFNIKDILFQPNEQDFALFGVCPKKELRRECFWVDMYRYASQNQEIEIKKFCEVFLGGEGLRYSKKEQLYLFKIISGFKDLDVIKEETCNFFIAKYHAVIDQILPILQISNPEKFCMINKEYQTMIKAETPFTLKQLRINGKDLLRAYPEMQGKQIAFILNRLLFKCIQTPSLNQKEKLMEISGKYVIN